MNKLIASLVLALGATTAAHADIMQADFNLRYIDGSSAQVAKVDSLGSLTLSLNTNGTIDAFLNVAADQNWTGVAIDAADRYTASNIGQGASTGWWTSIGMFNSGLYCSTCSGPVSWTIGDVGQFTSVQQALTGNGSNYDAFLYGSFGQYAGNMEAASAVPEPASLALLGLGLAGVGIARRRSGSTQRAG